MLKIISDVSSGICAIIKIWDAAISEDSGAIRPAAAEKTGGMKNAKKPWSVRLFAELPEKMELRLAETKSYNGIVELRYEKR